MAAIRMQPCRDDPGERPLRAALDALSDAVDWAYGGFRLPRRRGRAAPAAFDSRRFNSPGRADRPPRQRARRRGQCCERPRRN